MPRFTMPIGIPPDLADAEADFLVGILGYRTPASPRQRAPADFGARWFEADDGTQVHLEPRPRRTSGAAMAHTASTWATSSMRLRPAAHRSAGVRFKTAEFDGNRIMLCKDPRRESLGAAQLAQRRSRLDGVTTH